MAQLELTKTETVHDKLSLVAGILNPFRSLNFKFFQHALICVGLFT